MCNVKLNEVKVKVGLNALFHCCLHGRVLPSLDSTERKWGERDERCYATTILCHTQTGDFLMYLFWTASYTQRHQDVGETKWVCFFYICPLGISSGTLCIPRTTLYEPCIIYRKEVCRMWSTESEQNMSFSWSLHFFFNGCVNNTVVLLFFSFMTMPKK